MNPILDAYQQPFDYAPTVKLKQANVAVQRRLVTFASPSRSLNRPLQGGC